MHPPRRAHEGEEGIPRAAVDAGKKLLQDLERIEGSELVFLGRKPLQPLGDMSLTACMRRMGDKGLKGRVWVPHGCRSTFWDWASEKTSFPGDVAKMAPAHIIYQRRRPQTGGATCSPNA